MPNARRKLLALSIVLPTVAAGVFTFAPAVQADCSSSPNNCCYANNSYQLGECLYQGCERDSKCLAGGVDAYWQSCGC